MKSTDHMESDICFICYENKANFVYCKISEKHKWCLDCYSSILSNTERCPFCRNPMIEHDNLYSSSPIFSPLNFPSRDYSPSPPRRR